MSFRLSAPMLATAAILSCVGLSQANAQAAAPQPLAGPVIPGICILSNEQLVQQSSLGKAIAARMQQLGAQVKAELGPEQTALENEAKALRASNPQPTDPRIPAFQQKLATFERKAQMRNRELEMTQQKALARLATESDPVIRQVYTQRGCGLLVDRSAVFGGNAQMDVTGAAVTALNAKITTITFERERLPATATAAAAPVKK